MKIKNKCYDGSLARLGTDRYAPTAGFFLRNSSTICFTSPPFLWISHSDGCTSSFYVYWKDILRSRNSSQKILPEYFLFPGPVYTAEKVKINKENPTGVCITINLLSTSQFSFPGIASSPAQNHDATHLFLFLYNSWSFVTSFAENGGCQGRRAIISYHISQSMSSV